LHTSQTGLGILAARLSMSIVGKLSHDIAPEVGHVAALVEQGRVLVGKGLQLAGGLSTEPMMILRIDDSGSVQTISTLGSEFASSTPEPLAPQIIGSTLGKLSQARESACRGNRSVHA